jgi:radical SAM protein with 4Fe4S-binding SPASM domain
MMNLANTLNFARNLNFERSVNASKLISGFYISKLKRESATPALPYSISIEPTTACNLRCPQCISGKRDFTRPTGMINENLFQKIIDQTQHHLLYLNFYFQGEPFLHPQFTDMVKYASAKKIYTSTSTNAHFLNDENAKKTIQSGLNRLIISIDGATDETYKKYRIGGDLEKVKMGIANLSKWKKQLKASNPHVVLQFIVFKHNENEVDDFIKFAKQSGANDYVLKSAQIYDFENADDLLPVNAKYKRYSNKNKIEAVENNRCWKMWHSCVITWDGKVVPCCFDKDANHAMGDLNQQSFTEIWTGSRYQKFRNQLFKSRKEIAMCANCSEGAKVWVG